MAGRTEAKRNNLQTAAPKRILPPPDSLVTRLLIAFAGIVLLTALTITVFVQFRISREMSATEDKHAESLLNTVLLNVENEYQSYRFYKSALIRERKRDLEHICELAVSQIRVLFEKQQSGALSEQEAKRRAIEIIRNMRYDAGVGYLWIQNDELPVPRMLMHPAVPKLEGKIADDQLFYDALGGERNLLSIFVDSCVQNGDGYLEYKWPKPTKDGLIDNQSKISYVQYFKPWGWIIGTGVYIDDIERESRSRIDSVISELQRTFSKVRIAESGYMFIFNGKKKIIIHPEFDKFELADKVNPASGRPILDELMEAAGNKDNAWDYVWDKPPDYREEYNYSKRAYMAYFEPLDWYIGASVYEDEIDAAAIALRWEILGISGIFVLIAIALSFVFSRSLTKPIRKLTNAARQIEKKGFENATINAEGTIETQELGRCLNSMIRSINDAVKAKESAVDNLQLSEENHRITLKSIGDGVIATDKEGRVTHMNPVAESLTGWNFEDIQGKKLTEVFKIINAHTRETAINPVDNVLENGEIVGLANHTILISRGGKEIPIADSGAPIKDENGNITGVVMVFRDVTEDYYMQEALRKSEEFLQNVFDAIQDGISVLDCDLNVLRTNQWMEKIYTDQMPLTGKKCYEVYQQRDTVCPWCPSIKTIETGEPKSEIVPYPSEDDPKGWIELSAYPIKNENGEVTNVIEYVKDVTESKVAENALKESEEKYRSLVENSLQGMVIAHNNPVRLSFASKPMEEITGFSCEDLINMKPEELSKLIHPEDREKFFGAFVSRLSGKNVPARSEYRIIRKHGAIRWVVLFSTLVEYEGLPASQTVFFDISDQKKAEQDLVESQKMLSDVLNTIPVHVFWKDKDGVFLGCNQLIARDAGLNSPEEVVGHTDYEMPWAEQADMYRKDDLQVIESGREKVNYEETQTTNEGKTIWLRTSKIPLRNSKGETYGVLGTYEDITERKMANLALIESEKRYRGLFENVPVGLYQTTPEGEILDTNQALIQMLSYPDKNTLLDTDVSDIFVNINDRKKQNDILLREGLVHGFETEMLQYDGNIIWVRDTVRAVKSDDGEILYYEGSLEDITERRLTEDALKASEQKYRGVVETSPDAIVLLDLDAKVLYANEMFAKIHGLQSPEIWFGKSAMELLAPEEHERASKTIDRIINKGLVTEINFTFVRKDGSRFPAEISGNVIKNPDGSPQALLIFARDITERRKNEEEIRKIAKLESLGILAGGIAHNFKNILAAMSLSVEIAKINPKAIKKQLDRLLISIDQATALATKFQTFTKTDAPDLKPTKINEIIIEAAEISLSGSRSRAVFELDEQASMVMADSKQMNEIFINLLINADQAMPRGGSIFLKSQNTYINEGEIQGLEKGRYVCITVRDEGIGISKTNLKEIFTPFFTTKAKGHGLGLSSVYYIVEKHNGIITVDSELDKGTVFDIYLPVAETPEEKDKDKQKASPRTDRQIKVLLLDDDEDIIANMKVLARFLDDIELICHSDPNKAITKFRKELSGTPFDIAILDLTLTGYDMDGHEVLKILKEEDQNIAALVFSGHSSKPIVANFEEYGFDGRLEKPCSMDSMKESIYNMMKARED